MFNGFKKAAAARNAPDSICTLLGEGSHWLGEIHAGSEGLRIEGIVEGTVFSEGQVVVAPTGLVKGTIHAKHLTVRGRVEGVFKVSGCLEILGTGWVEGEAEMGSLVVDEGGTLQGSCQPLALRPKAQEPVPLVPRLDERVQERGPERFTPTPAVHAAVGSGTHGPVRDFAAAGRIERRRS
jgi:cytoskeletal protein CcmA (bactofilin family)